MQICSEDDCSSFKSFFFPPPFWALSQALDLGNLDASSAERGRRRNWPLQNR